MKLIIDIPEDSYKNIREYYEKNDIVEATYSYIYHGIPLDKIRAEIEELKLSFFDNERTIDAVLSIIDKYREEQE